MSKYKTLLFNKKPNVSPPSTELFIIIPRCIHSPSSKSSISFRSASSFWIFSSWFFSNVFPEAWSSFSCSIAFSFFLRFLIFLSVSGSPVVIVAGAIFGLLCKTCSAGSSALVSCLVAFFASLFFWFFRAVFDMGLSVDVGFTL